MRLSARFKYRRCNINDEEFLSVATNDGVCVSFAYSMSDSGYTSFLGIINQRTTLSLLLFI